ncbi:MAG: hypothetical protein ABEJ73_07390 [Haloplanus sp.]
MESRQPKSKELIVKAEYFVGIEPSEENLRSLQTKLIQIMREEGFETENTVLPYVAADRVLEFIRIPPPGSKSRWEKLISKLTPGSNQRNPFDREEFLDGLERLRDDLPFRVVFRFKTFHGEDVDGYDIYVESTPALLQKARQLKLHEDYNYSVENIVDQNKRELERILDRLELEPLNGPYTEAEKLETRLADSTAEKLEEHEYGRTALQYINEGDQCLKQNLLHAALPCYIQAIEWIILHHQITEENEDLVEKQQSGEIGPVFFHELVDKISDNTDVSQKTISKLNNFNQAERRWIAHHKTGQLDRQDVENVRTTLLRLSNELIPERQDSGQ